MKKSLMISGILLVLLVIIGVFLIWDRQDNSETNDANEAHDIEHNPDDKDEPIIDSTGALIDEVFQLAAEGKVPDVSIVAGHSELDEVMTEWGEPTSETTTEAGTYIDYSTSQLTVGYSGNNVFDVRSFTDALKEIHYQDIIDAKGEPDEQRYYKDEQVDQIILVYQMNENYQLKWILPRPTDAVPNPTVHHISVYTDITKLDMDIPSLVDSMSLNEKIGQMIMGGIDGTTPTPETINLIEDYKLGGIIFFSKNLIDVGQSLDLVNGIKRANASNKVPLFLSVDQEGGLVQRLPGVQDLPTNKEIGLRNDPDLSYQIGGILGQELKAFGMNLNYVPVMDVNSNPDNPVIGDRSFGDNPALVSELGIQTMKGMEAENIIPVIKHFPGHGDTAVDSHLELPRIDKSLQELRELELIPFTNAIQEGVDVVMVAHILFPQLDTEYPSSMSKPIITDLLRDELNFDGVVITDDIYMDAIKSHYEVGNAAVQSIKAGSDIVLISKEYADIVSGFDALKQAVETGEITEDRLNESVSRILKLKQKYQLTDEETSYQDLQKLNETIKNIGE
ncbi:beta-N-acetylhexosaminidase [Ornithinibacillus contaminans]|uniref:beta-N-acetylhexosaminidase n=1 Tax=Ornithinibacillus contaminans TaxID=694055 RepID=UPI000B0B5B93|nr:beta-N-acetylhexosaminidase [Ornithinibacillus contaminans]